MVPRYNAGICNIIIIMFRGLADIIPGVLTVSDRYYTHININSTYKRTQYRWRGSGGGGGPAGTINK